MTYASIYSKNEPQNFKIEINFIKSEPKKNFKKIFYIKSNDRYIHQIFLKITKKYLMF